MSKTKKKSYNVEYSKLGFKKWLLYLLFLSVLAYFSPFIIRYFLKGTINIGSDKNLAIRLISFLVFLCFWCSELTRKMRYANKKMMRGKEMGTARFEDVEEFSTKMQNTSNPNCNMIFSMNGKKSLDSKATLLNNNTLVVGGSGAGKTAGFIAVNLLQNYGCNIITDPKGDTARDFGKALEMKGRVVKKLDLTEMQYSMQYNPFKYVRKLDELGELVDNIIQNTTDPDAKGGDPFWENAESMFDKFLFFYTYECCPCDYYKYTTYKINNDSILIDLDEELPNMKDEIMADAKFGNRVKLYKTPMKDKNGNIMRLNQTFRTVLTLLGEAEIKDRGASDLDCRVLMYKEQLKAKGVIPDTNKTISNYNKTMRGASDTVRSIVISSNARFDKFANEDLFRILDDDELDLESIFTGKIAGKKEIVHTDLFLVIPDDKSTYNFIVGMLYTQLFQIGYQVARENNGKCPMSVGLWMDEFANIKMPSDFKKILATCRSRDIFIVIIIQALSQLKTLYPQEEWEEVVGNCDSFLYLGGNEQGSHKYVSEILGKMTIDKESSSDSLGKQGSHSLSNDVLGRELMTDAEVSMLPNNECIFRVRGHYPVRDKKCYWFLMEEYNYIKKLDKWNIKIKAKKEELFNTNNYIFIENEEEYQKENNCKINTFLFSDLCNSKEKLLEKETKRNQEYEEKGKEKLEELDIENEIKKLLEYEKTLDEKIQKKEKVENEINIKSLIYNMDFSEEQFKIIQYAIDNNVKYEDFLKFANPNKSVTQMKFILDDILKNN